MLHGARRRLGALLPAGAPPRIAARRNVPSCPSLALSPAGRRPAAPPRLPGPSWASARACSTRAAPSDEEPPPPPPASRPQSVPGLESAGAGAGATDRGPPRLFTPPSPSQAQPPGTSSRPTPRSCWTSWPARSTRRRRCAGSGQPPTPSRSTKRAGQRGTSAALLATEQRVQDKGRIGGCLHAPSQPKAAVLKSPSLMWQDGGGRREASPACLMGVSKANSLGCWERTDAVACSALLVSHLDSTGFFFWGGGMLPCGLRIVAVLFLLAPWV